MRYALLVLLIALCTPSWAQTIRDSSGKKVSVDNPQRIVTIAGNVTETVFALGFGGKVVAVDASSIYPASVKKLPQVGYYRNINAEGVLSQNPDLIIMTDAAGPPPVLAQLKGSGVPLAVLSSAKTFEGAQERIVQIGTLLGKAKEGQALAKKMADRLKAMVKPKVAPKVLFIYARGQGTQNVAGKKTSANAMIELAGGVNAVSGYEGYKPMSAEAIIAAAPDYVLFTSKGLASVGGVDAVAKMSGIAQTPAGQNKRIIAIDDLVLLGFGPRTAEGVLELSRAIQK